MNLVFSVVNVLEFVLRCVDCTPLQMNPIFVSLKDLFRVKNPFNFWPLSGVRF
jgi:hypothetical protein